MPTPTPTPPAFEATIKVPPGCFKFQELIDLWNDYWDPSRSIEMCTNRVWFDGERLQLSVLVSGFDDEDSDESHDEEFKCYVFDQDGESRFDPNAYIQRSLRIVSVRGATQPIPKYAERYFIAVAAYLQDKLRSSWVARD